MKRNLVNVFSSHKLIKISLVINQIKNQSNKLKELGKLLEEWKKEDLMQRLKKRWLREAIKAMQIIKKQKK